MKFFIGLVLFVLGTLLAINYKKVTEVVGLQIAWAERYLGSTYYAYFLFGVVGILLGLLIMLNFIDLGFLGI